MFCSHIPFFPPFRRSIITPTDVLHPGFDKGGGGGGGGILIITLHWRLALWTVRISNLLLGTFHIFKEVG